MKSDGTDDIWLDDFAKQTGKKIKLSFQLKPIRN